VVKIQYKRQLRHSTVNFKLLRLI